MADTRSRWDGAGWALGAVVLGFFAWASDQEINAAIGWVVLVVGTWVCGVKAFKRFFPGKFF